MWSCNRTWLSVVLLSGGGWSLCAAPLQFRTHELPRGVFGAPYHAQVQTQVDGRCPIGDVVLEMAGGSLPRGIEILGDVLTGIPKEFGVFRIQLRATNRCAAAVEDFSLEVTGKPILRAMPEELAFEFREGDSLPKPQVVLVSASWADLAYTVRLTSAPWLSFSTNQGATPYEGSPFAGDVVTVAVSPEGLAPGVYHSLMTFSADLGANMPQIPVTFRVLPRAPAPAAGTAPAH